MSGHTPGPWVAGVSNSVITSAPADLRIICQPFTDATYGPILSPEEQRANAKLMAAAPDLLEAAQKTVDAWAKFIDSFNYAPGIGDKAEDMEFREILKLRAAIARAKGEA